MTGEVPADGVLEESPLGQYAPADVEGELHDVHLLGLPVRLLLAAREHHDGLLRELRLLALSGTGRSGDTPARLVELTQILGIRFGAARQRQDREVDEAGEQGVPCLDLSYRVPAGMVEAIVALDQLMAEANAFCAAESLMTLERPAVVRQFGAWYLGEFVRQCRGAAPIRWNGPLDV